MIAGIMSSREANGPLHHMNDVNADFVSLKS